MEGLELLSFQMISFNGSARSSFIEGHRVHAKLIQEEAQNEGVTEINLLLIHAEDQMMSAEVFKIVAAELIDIHKKIQ